MGLAGYLGTNKFGIQCTFMDINLDMMSRFMPRLQKNFINFASNWPLLCKL